MNAVIRLAHRRPVLIEAIRFVCTLDGPLQREYPWAMSCMDFDGVYRVIAEERDGPQLLLPWRIAA